MELLNINDSENIMNIKSMIIMNSKYEIYLNSVNGKFKLKSIEELDKIILDLKNFEFNGLDMVFSKEIDQIKNEINIWVTPIVKSA